MGRVKLDFRRQLQATARRVQDGIVARLIAGQKVTGGPVAPTKDGEGRRTTSFGIRVALDAVRRPGIRTGRMLRELAKRSNVKMKPTGFVIRPSAALLRWIVFNAGAKPSSRRPGGQPARPVGGMSGAEVGKATREVARAGRDQIVKGLRRRPRASR